MSSPDMESLRLLVLVDELGSLGRAAAELRIAQPSASKRMSTLERGLGVVLLQRSKRGSTLTEDGRAVAGWAHRVLDELDGLLTGARALRTKNDAQLRVAASMTLAEYFAPGWLSQLRAAHPRLHVGLEVTNSSRVALLVRGGDVDIGFVESPSVPHGLSRRTVARDRLVVVVAPQHRWTRRKRPLRIEELAATPLILREQGSGTRRTVERALAAAGFEPVSPLVELGSAQAVRSAVFAGAGPAVISELAVASDVAEGRLARVEVAGLDLARTLHAVWPSGRKPAGAAAELLALASGRQVSA